MTTHPTRRASLLAGLFVCALGLSGCEPSDPHAGHDHADHDHADHDNHAAGAEFVPFVATADAEGARWTYEDILGVVTAVPVEGDPASELRIHHEHIPDFVAPQTGEINVNTNGSTGMRAMVMDMPPGEGMDVSSLNIGDKVRFTFAVWDEPRISWRVTRIERVEPATEISFDDKP